MNLFTQTAIRHLRREGFTVFVRRHSVPGIGSAWQSRHGPPAIREVVEANQAHVAYRVRGADMPPHRITLPSWHDWRGRTRARVVP